MLEDKIQAVADLRIPIKEDQSFYDNANMTDVVRLAMQGGDVKPALGELSGRFIKKHKGQAKVAVGMGAEVAKEIHKGE